MTPLLNPILSSKLATDAIAVLATGEHPTTLKALGIQVRLQFAAGMTTRRQVALAPTVPASFLSPIFTFLAEAGNS